jgi:hypothetical protein
VSRKDVELDCWREEGRGTIVFLECGIEAEFWSTFSELSTPLQRSNMPDGPAIMP